MKKLLVIAVVLSFATGANAALNLAIDVNAGPWNGSDSVGPSDTIKLTLSTDAALTSGMLNTYTNISLGDGSSGNFPATGWLVGAGSVNPDGNGGLNVFFNSATLFPFGAGNIWDVTFHVPDGTPGSTDIVIDANAGEWSGVNTGVGGNTDTGLPYTVIHVTPEPLTLSLLGLGSLALIRRRRRA